MAHPFVLCDVFAERPFAGNQLAVFVDGRQVGDQAMAELAREFGWSEITFVLPASNGGSPRVRIWTPSGELPFAGHPTVGTAVVLASRGDLPVGPSALELGIGQVGIDVLEADRSGGVAAMTQRSPEFGDEFADRDHLARSLGLTVDDLDPDLPAQMVSTGLPHFLVPLRSIDALQAAAPMAELPDALQAIGARWAYVFTTDTPGTNAAARARLLNVGMEDAATGSAAGPLGAYLVNYGLHRAGEMDIEQGIEMGRPSRLSVSVPQQDGEIGPVRVSGRVCIWGHGSLDLV